MFNSPRFEHALPWLLRAAWIGVLVVGGGAVDGATADRSAGVQNLSQYGGLALWLVGVAAMAVLAPISLTAVRVTVPLTIPAAMIVWVAGATAIDAVMFLCLAILSTALAFSGEIGRSFVQASAYGDEDRYPLRPPAGYALAAGIAWIIMTAALFSGPLLIATHNWFAGVPIILLAIAAVVRLAPRWHRLARRWFVMMPTGIVVHDHLVLAETLMLPHQEVATMRLAPADTEAADMTGPAAGHAIEIVTVESVTAIFAATPARPSGGAIHLTACLVAPTRPGRVLAAAAEHHIQVG